ncbi:type VI secretion system membrane subunit TssM [Pseudoalteromonas umbrosa]|uniref:type VI secretion system membrane subunit TssM n=1 Tax=Pseudoalteromonas umbrosa TaxID=3048489 RepID=UPI0024C43D57|nr:type VI secretion system membrane subunit TssM [Pseudoalteromonas sp. B95]MDK1288249.1 type VI secretion system membrane subunit TssM [Pseudoalteromonas sp. B95]
MAGSVNKSGLIHLLLNFFSSRATAKWIGLFALLSLAWFGGRFIGLGGVDQRLWLMGGIFVVFMLVLFVRWLWAKRSGDKLASELANHNASSEAEVAEIKEKMQDALAALKASHLGAGYRGNTALYALPWYMIIGPSATGKSTLFANSGLHFPYSKSNQMHIQGFGGTRNCDWWFSDQAILIDTAGRYTTEESDKEQWLSFLKLLKKNRPKLPINGVMVAISIADILTSDTEQVRDHVKQIRTRIDELINQLGIIFPIYIVFTKTDLISGFEPFFNELSEQERLQPWGAYLLDKNQTPTSDEACDTFNAEMESMYQRLCQQRLVKMTRERDTQRKQLIYDFPNQFKAASDKVSEFVEILFKENPFQEIPWFAGVYFTSGTQEGVPIERSSKTKLATFRSVLFEYRQQSLTSAFFVNKVFNEVMFKLQDLTKGNRKKRKIQKWVKGLAICTSITAIGLMSGLLFNSYTHNTQLLDTGELLSKHVIATSVEHQSEVEQFNAVLALFEHYQTLEAYEQKLPWYFLLGVYSADTTKAPIKHILQQRVQSLIGGPAAQQIATALASSHTQWQDLQMAEEQVIKRVEPQLRDSYYNLMKFQLMMSDEFARLDHAFVSNAILSMVAQRLELDIEADETAQTTEKMRALVNFYIAQLRQDTEAPGLDVWASQEHLIAQARANLTTDPQPDVIYGQIKDKVSVSNPELTLDQMMSQNNKTFLKSELTVPYVFTQKAWQSEVYSEIKRRANIAFSGDWVMGTEQAGAEGAIDEAKANELASAIRALYFKEYATAWFDFINAVEVRPFNTSNAASLTLGQLSSTQGPLVDLMKAIDANINLSNAPLQEPEKLSGVSEKIIDKVKSDTLLGNSKGLESLSSKKVPELAQRFADLRRYTSVSEEAQISDYLQQYLGALSAFHSDIKDIAASNDDDFMAMEFSRSLLTGEDKENALQSAWVVVESQVRALDPDSKQVLERLLKAPLLASVQTVMNEARSQLNDRWYNNVYISYKDNLKGKYPFNLTGPDAAVEDISELLNRDSGIFWEFMDANLAPFLKLKRGVWVEKTWNGIGLGFDKPVLDKLTKARKVTRSLFPREGSEVGISFQMMPVAQRGVRETYIGYSDQSYRYRNEPEEWRRFTWPARTGAEKATIYGMDRKGNRIEIQKDGPWALLKILNEARVKWVKGTEYMATWELLLPEEESSEAPEHIQVQVALKSSRNSGIFSKYFMSSFALPEALFTGRVQLASQAAKQVQ